MVVGLRMGVVFSSVAESCCGAVDCGVEMSTGAGVAATAVISGVTTAALASVDAELVTRSASLLAGASGAAGSEAVSLAAEVVAFGP